MRRREDRDMTKHTLNLYAGDYAKIQALYSTRVGAAKIIRDIVHAHIRRIEESAAQRTRFDLEIQLEASE
jgi:hypothetical protein